MRQTLYEEALEQLTAWRGQSDRHAPVRLYDGSAVVQSATRAIAHAVTTRAGLMSLQGPKPQGFDGWLGDSASFECSRDERMELLAAGANDMRSALSKKLDLLREQHIQAKGSPPTVVRISPADESAWAASGVPDQIANKFKREGRRAVIRFLDMHIEWDVTTTVVE